MRCWVGEILSVLAYITFLKFPLPSLTYPSRFCGSFKVFAKLARFTCESSKISKRQCTQGLHVIFNHKRVTLFQISCLLHHPTPVLYSHGCLGGRLLHRLLLLRRDVVVPFFLLPVVLTRVSAV